ncbi:MAG: hypothetical protein AB2792_19760 [Candidatus Thiodiazotropha sp.]
MTKTAYIYRAVIIALAIVFLFASWVGMLASLLGVNDAVQEYGPIDIRVLLDAEFAYYGLFAFGTATISILLANKVNRISRFTIYRLFRINFFLSIIFLLPMLVSPIFFLLE